MTEKQLKEIAVKRGFIYRYKFTALRDTLNGDDRGDGILCANTYSKEDGIVGSEFTYNSKTDTLYARGYGLFVIYEKGVWAKSHFKAMTTDQVNDLDTLINQIEL